MKTFGFSAFLKLVCSSERVRATEIRRRLSPISSGGYDFHKQMRGLARRYFIGGESISSLRAAAERISSAPEAKSALAALGRMEAWRAVTPGQIVEMPGAVYESPGRIFRMKFEPAFGVYMSGRAVPVEIWNTKKPALAAGPVYAALSLAAEGYAAQGIDLLNIGLLSLREPVHLYQLTDHPRQAALASSLIDSIEEMLRQPPPARPQPDDRPIP